MAGKEELEIVFGADGRVQVHVKGIKGKKCLDVQKKIEKILGTVVEQKLTREYYEQEDTTQLHQRT
ncbi:MAG: DUF2997 domain-containing protein [Vulcanimicrobiota bacterium]